MKHNKNKDAYRLACEWQRRLISKSINYSINCYQWTSVRDVFFELGFGKEWRASEALFCDNQEWLNASMPF